MSKSPARVCYTLLGDGSSDQCLRRIIDWTIKGYYSHSDLELDARVADFRYLKSPPKGLADRITRALREFPCDILFVHRDAEGETREKRVLEIEGFLSGADMPGNPFPVPLVPVRMTEAWLLISEFAIRMASDNPKGNMPLKMPRVSRLEAIPDPKTILKDLLVSASGKTGRRRQRFEQDLSKRIHFVAEHIDDFSPLRSLSAFQAFEQSAHKACQYAAQKSA